MDESIDNLIAQFKDIDHKSTEGIMLDSIPDGMTIKSECGQPLFVFTYWKWTLFMAMVLFVYVLLVVMIINPKTVYTTTEDQDNPVFSWKRYFIVCFMIWIFLLLVMYVTQFCYFRYIINKQ